MHEPFGPIARCLAADPAVVLNQPLDVERLRTTVCSLAQRGTARGIGAGRQDEDVRLIKQRLWGRDESEEDDAFGQTGDPAFFKIRTVRRFEKALHS